MDFNKEMILNPDTNKVKEVKEKLKLDKHCPCMIVKNEDTVCPCKPCRIKSVCICGLYIRKENIND